MIECVLNYTLDSLRRGDKTENEHRDQQVPKSVEASNGSNVTILWNQQVQTTRIIRNNKPDIIIRDNKKRT
jgi:hypothetical protein